MASAPGSLRYALWRSASFGITWTPKVCEIMAFEPFLVVLGFFFWVQVSVEIIQTPKP